MDILPGKTVERLSQYRRNLLRCLQDGKEYIFSHELAAMHHITAVQVRRDLMLLGFSSVYRKGYPVRELVEMIGQSLDSSRGLNTAIIGLGNLGIALAHYLGGLRPKLHLVAVFDVDKEKIGKSFGGVKCYSFSRIKDTIQSKKIKIGIITVPQMAAEDVGEKLVESEVKGILNFTHIPLIVPPNIYLEEYDMITSLEKVAYFVKKMK